MSLANKNVVYIGGFGGIGQKVCPQLLQQKVKALAVFDLAPNEQLLQEWQAKHPNTEIFYHKLDIAQKSELELAYKAAAERMAHFDLVINGSGIGNEGNVELITSVNLAGLINSSFIALDYMDRSKAGQGGCIVNMSSVAGLEPIAPMAVYSATKHGVTAFTRALADPEYYARTGVAFITICPGQTDTPIIQSKITFESDISVKDKMCDVGIQTAETCAQLLLKAIEIGKNGSVWIVDVGELHELHMPVVYAPRFK